MEIKVHEIRETTAPADTSEHSIPTFVMAIVLTDCV